MEPFTLLTLSKYSRVQAEGKFDVSHAESEALRVDESFGWHLPMSIEATSEMFVEIFDSQRTQFVKATADFHAQICMGIGRVLR